MPAKTYYASPSVMFWAWYLPCYADFVLQKDLAMGNFNHTTFTGLKGLFNVIHSRWLSFRRSNVKADSVKMVTDYQHVFLKLYAIMNFYQMIDLRMHMHNVAAEDSLPADPCWLWAFTRAPLTTEQFFAACIPVWLIQDEAEVSKEIVIHDIVASGSPFAWPFKVIWRGLAGGEEMHERIHGIIYIVKDHGKRPDTTSSTSKVWGVQSTDFWEVAENVFLPAPITVVSAVFPYIKAMVEGKKITTQAKEATGCPDVMHHYFANWLAIRPAWIQFVIMHHPHPQHPRFGISWGGDNSVPFRKDTVQVFKSIPPAKVYAITWEFYQALVPTKWRDSPDKQEAIWWDIFPLKMVGDMWDALLPTENNGVLHTLDEHDKFHMLNALAHLLSELLQFMIGRHELSMQSTVFVVMLLLSAYSEFISTGTEDVITRSGQSQGLPTCQAR
ncbi:hypothetical protein OG21DRAFT_1525617 [Imleria badia]|nr:hypothetical protein OG21DRAFT_1525617 [Imleria badia]